MQRAAPVLSIVIPCFNESESFPHTRAALLALLDDLVAQGLVEAGSFLFFVDDGSSDDTWAQIDQAHRRDGRVKGLRLSRNFGHQNALMAGLMSVRERSDASVSIDADLQQEPAAIGRFVQRYRDGVDVVLGVRTDRSSDGLFKRKSAEFFYSSMAFMGVKLLRNHADYRLLSQRAMQALAGYQESQIFLRAICTELGFRQEAVQFEVRERPYGESKYSLRKMLRLAIHGVTSFSVAPLRMVSIVGLSVFVLSILMSCYVLFRTLVVGDTVPGWASTALPIYLIGGIQILCLGVVGEYVGQVYSNVKQRPRYINDTELFEALRNVALFAAYVLSSSFGLQYMKGAPTLASLPFVIGFGLYGGGFLLWMLILRSFPLSVAFPVSAGALMIGTTLCAALMLGEPVGRLHIGGIALILAGIILISVAQK